jgi:outer membrane protein, heavy metal efflux system
LDADPAVRSAASQRAQAEAQVRSTRQRPNPELETKGTWGDGASQVEIDLVQTVETGGKRSARIERARAGEDEASAELLAAKGEAALKTVSALYRLRQVLGELSLVDEALKTFSRIGQQLRSRPRLAPEQEVSRSIFELAEADYALRRAGLGAEQKALLKSLEISTGLRLSTGTVPLPETKQDWPEIPKAGSSADPGSLQAQAALKAAAADRREAQAAAWPDLRLGPSFQRQSSEGQAQRMVGMNLALPLPLYHRNAGGRERARRAEESAALRLAAIQALVGAEREAERARYEAAVAALKSTASRKDVHASHERIEDFFQRGLISSSLVIEAHRQILEFTKDRNEHELAAVRALWRIRVIDGQVSGASL